MRLTEDGRRARVAGVAPTMIGTLAVIDDRGAAGRSSAVGRPPLPRSTRTIPDHRSAEIGFPSRFTSAKAIDIGAPASGHGADGIRPAHDARDLRYVERRRLGLSRHRSSRISCDGPNLS